MPEQKCIGCGETFTTTRKQANRGQKYCSIACYHLHPARKSFVGTNGYRQVWTGEKWMAEHRFVVEQALGRALFSSENVHHEDGNRLNNDIKNLIVFTNKSEHRIEHCKVRHALTYKDVTCHECGKVTSIKMSRYVKNKSGLFYCSLKCALKNRHLTLLYIWEQRRMRGNMHNTKQGANK